MKYVLNFNVMKDKYRVIQTHIFYPHDGSIIDKLKIRRDNAELAISHRPEVHETITAFIESDINLNISVGEKMSPVGLTDYEEILDSFIVKDKTINIEKNENGNDHFVVVVDLESIDSIPTSEDSEEYKIALIELEERKEENRKKYQRMIDDYNSKNLIVDFSECDDHVVFWDYNPHYVGSKSLWDKIKRLWE